MNRIACAAVLLCASAQTQWSIQDSHTTADLRGIHSLGNGVAWASGTQGTVLRTTNDGKDWQRCTTPPDADHLDFHGIQAFDEKHAVVMSSGKGLLSRLYKTTDACQTWKLLFSNPDPEGFWDAVKFNDVDHGFILGDPVPIGSSSAKRFVLDQTFDGGKLWTEWQTKEPKLYGGPGASVFAASNSSLLTEGRFSALFVTGGLSSRLYFMTAHGHGICNCTPMPSERDWNNQLEVKKISLALFPKSETGGIFSVAKNQRGALVAVGGDYAHPDNRSGTAAFSDQNEGWTWYPAQTQPQGFRSAVAYDPTTRTWITVGPNGTDISTDDGRNWRPLRPAPTDPPDADRHWNALSLPFVVGPHGRIGKLNPQALRP